MSRNEVIIGSAVIVALLVMSLVLCGAMHNRHKERRHRHGFKRISSSESDGDSSDSDSSRSSRHIYHRHGR